MLCIYDILWLFNQFNIFKQNECCTYRPRNWTPLTLFTIAPQFPEGIFPPCLATEISICPDFCNNFLFLSLFWRKNDLSLCSLETKKVENVPVVKKEKQKRERNCFFFYLLLAKICQLQLTEFFVFLFFFVLFFPKESFALLTWLRMNLTVKTGYMILGSFSPSGHLIHISMARRRSKKCCFFSALSYDVIAIVALRAAQSDGD